MFHSFDIEVDVVTNHNFSLRTLSETRIDEKVLSYLSLARASKLGTKYTLQHDR